MEGYRRYKELKDIFAKDHSTDNSKQSFDKYFSDKQQEMRSVGEDQGL